MAIATAAARQGNDVFQCGGAQIRAHCRHLATVVTIRGEIDAVDVDRASEYIRRFILANSPVVLDMSDVSHFAAAGIALLSTFDDECRAAGVEWALVASPAVLDLLDQCEQDEALFPVRYSVQEALRDLANAIVIRRQLVLPLIKKMA